MTQRKHTSSRPRGGSGGSSGPRAPDSPRGEVGGLLYSEGASRDAHQDTLSLRPQSNCKICGGPVARLRKQGGRPPEYCTNHRPNHNRRRDASTALKHGEVLLAEALGGVGPAAGLTPVERSDFSVTRRLAVRLDQTGGDVAAAAQLAGVREGSDLEAMVEAAKAMPRPSLANVADLANRTLVLQLLNLEEQIAKASPAQLAPMLGALGRVIDKLLGGATPLYSEVETHLLAADGARLE